MTQIHFIGYGNMAKAMVQGLSGNPHYALQASSPALEAGINAAGVSTHPDNTALLERADCVILAVKPAMVHAVLTQIKPNLPAHCVVVSLAAGIPLSALEPSCNDTQAIVRAMPNLAVAIHQGATPLIGNRYVTKEHQQTITQLFGSLGLSAWITKEADLDRYTALSGSGPAYVFLFIEAMIHAATRLGLSEKSAKAFCLQTFRGAIEMAQTSTIEIAALRQQVTSQGGTTAAAIEQFEKEGLDQTVFHAMEAAYFRAQQLNK